MSGNTSATGGYLSPTANPAYDQALEDQLQAAFAGITGIAGNLVRPMWDGAPAPAYPISWIAYAIKSIAPQDYAEMIQEPAGNGATRLEFDESITVRCSFYGAAAMGNACRLRDGFAVAQNGEALASVGLKYIKANEIELVPELINQIEWLRRCDLELTFRRRISRIYPVLNLLSATATFEVDSGNQSQATI